MKRILVVDDDAQITRMLRASLQGQRAALRDQRLPHAPERLTRALATLLGKAKS